MHDCHLVLSRHGEEVRSALVFDREVPIRDSGPTGRRYVGIIFEFGPPDEQGIRVGTHCNAMGEAALAARDCLCWYDAAEDSNYDAELLT
jgi:hypothetical protein